MNILKQHLLNVLENMCVPDSVDSCDSSVLTDIVTVSPFAPIFVQIDCARVSSSIIDFIQLEMTCNNVCVVEIGRCVGAKCECACCAM